MRLGKDNRSEVEVAEYMSVCQERDAYKETAEIYQKQARDLDEICKGLHRKEQDLLAAIINHTNRNGELVKERDALLARVKELEAYVSLLKTAQDERDAARQEADYLRKRCQRAEEGAASAVKAQEEVIERLKAQNARFVEEQREAKQRADATGASLIKAKDEVARLVELNNAFKDRLAAITQEKNAVVEISNNFARERDEIRADYDARGKVIKKLRKRLHKLKKKLKH